MVNHFALVGDGKDAYVLRQRCLELPQYVFYLVSELHDVAAFVHFYRENDALLPVVLYVFVGMWVFALDGCDVSQAYNVAARVRIDDAVGHIVFSVHLRTQVYRARCLSVVYLSAHHRHALCREVGQERGRIDAVVRQFVAVDVHANLFALFAANAQVGQFGDGSQVVFQRVHVFVQLTVAFGLAF